MMEDIDHLAQPLHDDFASKRLHPCHLEGLMNMSPAHHVERCCQVQTHLKAPIELRRNLSIMLVVYGESRTGAAGSDVVAQRQF